MISNGSLDADMYGVSAFQQGRTFMTPPRNPPAFYNNPSFSQPSMNNGGAGAAAVNPSAYMPDLHSHSVQSKFSHVHRCCSKSFHFVSFRFVSFLLRSACSQTV